jgi:hypothetical protein
MPNATLSAPLTFAPVMAVPACDVDAPKPDVIPPAIPPN